MKQIHNKILSSAVVAAFILVGFITIMSLLYIPIGSTSISGVMLVMLVFLILLWGMLLILMAKANYHNASNSPEMILKNRYANGEISKKEYLSMLKDIQIKA